MKKRERESIEWTNTWWSEADTDNKRGLLIGDSTTRQLRGSMEVLLTNLYAIDLFAASFSIHDKRIENYMDILFRDDEYKYDFIVLHYGGHHGFSRLCSENSGEYMAYMERYIGLLRSLTEKCEKVVCVTGTSEVMDTNVTMIDQRREHEIIARNQIVSDAARLDCIDVFDLYGLMKSNWGTYTYFDRQHFNRNSDYFISYNLIEFMRSRNIINQRLVEKQHLQGKNRLMEMWGTDKKYAIYGAGSKGIELYWILKWYDMEKSISCFTVSKETIERVFLQKPVVLISELGVAEREKYILIIASEQYRDEMFQTASAMGFLNVVFYSDVINLLFHNP